MNEYTSKHINEFPLTIHFKEKSGIRRVQEPIAIGIPFPKGLLTNSSSLALYSENDISIPLQVQVTARWRDQSIQWALLDFQASVVPYGEVTYLLKWNQGALSLPQDSLLTFVHNEGQYLVETGAASFSLSSDVFTPFNSILVGGVEVLDQRRSFLSLTDKDGQNLQAHTSSMVVECQGPVRLTLKFEGMFGNVNSSTPRYIARLSFFAGSGIVMLSFTLHNPGKACHSGGCWDLGDHGSMYFNDLCWAIGGKDCQLAVLGGRVNPKENTLSEGYSRVEIQQHSSGGQNWQSVNHVDRFGQVTPKIFGYQVKCDGTLRMKGKRSTPTLFLKTQDIAIAGTIQNFWQNFPKSLEVNNGQISLRFFPQQVDELYELQGGEQKTHTGVIAFTNNIDCLNAVNWVSDPLRPEIAPEWYAQSNAIRYLSPRNDDKEKEYVQLIETAIRPANSWFDRREVIDEYGWRNFGEIYADHEGAQSSVNTPIISHYNNQYDVVYGLLIEYLRTGEERWFSLAQDLARHVIDIDIYHTHEDRPAYNLGLFWHTGHYTSAATATHRTYSRKNMGQECLDSSYGGGPSNEHNYTTGLLYYYFLTGDPMAAEAVQCLADWVINMDDPQSTLLGKFDKRQTGLASETVEKTYHGPGRGAGNSINALIDAYILTRERRYFLKSEELIKRCIHPIDDIIEHKLEDVERRWSYTVFLVALGKYLDLKISEDELDYFYGYAREALLHYAAWMVEHEVPYKQILHRVAIPTETWPAQDMRKSHVLNVAAKYAENPLRTVCQNKARFFYDACLADLSTFQTSTYVRPIVLLLTNAHVQAYFDDNFDESFPVPIHTYDFGFPQKFTPQGNELHRMKEALSVLQTSMKGRARRLWGRGSRKGTSH